jgi:beta-lactamase regulating signal transducer with metallopeptidase domain
MPDVESWIAARLLTGTIQGAIVIAVVWLACRRFSGIPAPMQAALWWLASLKLLLVFVPMPAIALPLLPLLEAPVAVVPLPQAVVMAADPVPVPESGERFRWLSVVVAIWTGGLLWQAVRLGRSYGLVRGYVRRAVPLPSGETDRALAMARAVGLRRCPDVRLSSEITSPFVAGILRPVVLVPATLPDADRSMALCHEFVHVRRHDLALGWVPAIAERLFFFHPLARLAAREYITAREAACDAGVLRALGVSAGDYGRLLVRLGVARPEPLAAAGGAPASLASLRRRLQMLQQSPFRDRSRLLAWLLAAALVLFLMPFDVTARPAPPTPAVMAAVPAVPALPDLPAIDGPWPVRAPSASQERPAQAPRPVVPAAPEAAPAPRSVRPAAPAAPPWPTHPDFERYLRETQEQLRALQESVHAEFYRQTIEQADAATEQADRTLRAFAETILARKENLEAITLQQSAALAEQIEQLRVQQSELTRQLNDLAEQQRRIAEMQREFERALNKLNQRQF